MTHAEAAAQQREVSLTTIGRRSGKPRRVTIWVVTDGQRLFVRSGQGFRRDWPNNLKARGDATLELGGQSIKVKARHMTDPDDARDVSKLVRQKYGWMVRSSKPGEPPTLGEQATFELMPVS